MDANTILYSDMLDILFENRNKKYGAYALRKDYNKRLLAALGIMFFGVIVFAVCLSFKPKPKMSEGAKIVVLPKDPTLSTYRPVMKKPAPVVQPKVNAGARKLNAATIKNTTIAIVPDKMVTKIEVPKVSELEGRLISTQTTEGALGIDNIAQPAGNGGGNGIGSGTGHEATPPADDNSVFEKAEKMPEFPGGQSALTRFLLKNLRPMVDEEQRVIRVVVRFIVDKQGAVTGWEVMNSGGDEYDKEVLRVLKKMPNWKPASQNGQAVNVFMTLPVVFQTQTE